MSAYDFEDDIELSPQEEPFRTRRFDLLIDAWLQDCHNRLDKVGIDGKLNTATADGYEDDIAWFKRWWETFGPAHNWALAPKDLYAFRSYLTTVHSQYGRPLGYNSRKDALRRLRHLFKWAVENKHMGRDLAKWVPPVNGSAPLRTAVHIDYLRRMKDACYRTTHPLEFLATLAILMDTGMRRAECAWLNIEDIEISADGSGTIQIHHAKVVRNREVQGRTVVFSPSAGKYIAAYLDTRNDVAGPLFPSPTNRHIKPDTIYKRIRRLIELAGLEGKVIGPHDLRRRFVTTFRQMRRGESHDHLLSKQLGHSSTAMTSQYDLQGVEDLREVHISPFELIEGNGII